MTTTSPAMTDDANPYHLSDLCDADLRATDPTVRRIAGAYRIEAKAGDTDG